MCRLMSPNNQLVLSKIVTEILQQPGCKYKEKVVKGKIPTCLTILTCYTSVSVAVWKCFET